MSLKRGNFLYFMSILLMLNIKNLYQASKEICDINFSKTQFQDQKRYFLEEGTFSANNQAHYPIEIV